MLRHHLHVDGVIPALDGVGAVAGTICHWVLHPFAEGAVTALCKRTLSPHIQTPCALLNLRRSIGIPVNQMC